LPFDARDIPVQSFEGEQHMPHHFVTGDRVCLIEAHAELSLGQLGTVVQAYPMPGRYAVHFDGELQPRYGWLTISLYTRYD
jgi:hypothetical protein